jgi:hypothetical protein
MVAVNVLLYIIAVVCFVVAAIAPRVWPDVRIGWVAIGLLAWVLVPALHVWGVTN